MTRSSRILMIVAGYAAALLIAGVAVYLHASYTDPASSGMSAAGDAMLFVCVFTVAAIPATAATFHALRAVKAFWTVAATLSLIIATTAVAGLFAIMLRHDAATARATWVMLAPLRILFAPVLATIYTLAQLFAPSRATRMALLTAALVEAVAFLGAVFIWWHSNRS